MKTQRLLLLLLFWGELARLPAWAQGEFRTWCLAGGDFRELPLTTNLSNVKVTFSPGPGSPDSCYFGSPARFYGASPAGTASLSNAQGQLLVYGSVYGLMDRRNQPMPNSQEQILYPLAEVGTGIQELTLAPAPANDHDFYAFYWTQTAAEASQKIVALTYARGDMRGNGGFGEVVSKDHVITRTRNPRQTLVRHANNRDYWLLTRDLDGRGFLAFLLGPAGVSPVPVASLTGQTLEASYLELKAAPNGRRLVAGVRTGQASAAFGVGLYDFDNATGLVSHERVVQRSVDAALSASFSPNSQLLYTVEYPPRPFGTKRQAELWQTNLAGATEAEVLASRYWVTRLTPDPTGPGDGIQPGGLELAPDSTLWLSRYYTHLPQHPNTGALQTNAAAIVRYPNAPGARCGFEREAYRYKPGWVATYTLPCVITNMLYAPAALNYDAGCPNDSVQFWASSAGDPAGLRWDFGDPGSGAANQARGRLAAHRYARGGIYPVRLTLADGRVLTQTLTVAGAAADFTQANVFTPNGDGYNDWFVPVRTPLTGGQLRIFSRWGQPVFRTTDAALRWDGAGAAAGEYFYELTYPDCQGLPQRRRGVLTLVR